MIRPMRHLLLALALTLALPALAAAQTTPTAQVRLMWDANSEADLDGYVLSWGTTAPRVYSFAQGIAKDATQVELQLPAATYYFTIQAFNVAGQYSGYSNEVRLVLTTPTTVFISIPSHTSRVTPP